MVLPYKGNARFPGPAGVITRSGGSRIPGPLGFREVTSTKSATKSVKSFTMPEAWWSSTIVRVAVLDWKIGKRPATTDVKQGHLPNCPVAAILAALAHTEAGRSYLDGLITEYRGATVKTVLTSSLLKHFVRDDEDVDDKPQVPELKSNRYFSVKLGKERIELHDTFYVNYTDGTDFEPVFMGSPNDVLWPAVIEKACAIHFDNSYKELGNFKKHQTSEFWKLLVGTDPNGFEIKDSTDVEKLRDAARNAPKTPTIAATKDANVPPKLTRMHGYAVMGLSGKDIELYNPAQAATLTVSPDEMRDNFQLVLFGLPAK